MIVFYDEYIMPPFLDIERDYLQGRLVDTLEPGVSYCVSFWYSTADNYNYYIDRIGAYLDDGSIDTTANCGHVQNQYVPQVEQTGGIIADTLNWHKIEGSFVANGTERFITIGNFYSKVNTGYASIDPNCNWSAACHYGDIVIDDVSVIRSDLPAFAGNDTGFINPPDSLFLGRDEIGLDCEWYHNGNLIDSGAGIWIHVVSALDTYIVKQTLCGVVTWDTVVVALGDNVPYVNAHSIQLKLTPNPVTSQLTITANTKINSISIIDITGREVLRSRETMIDMSGLVSGVYFVRVGDVSGGVRTEKIIKQ